MSVSKIVIADDHVLIRRGLKKIIDADASLKVIGEVGDGLELLKFLQNNSPDLILLDISMPNLRGIEAIAEVKKVNKKVKILVLTMHSSKDFLCSAIRAGADGYVLKEDSDIELLDAVQKCLNGDYYISPVLSEGISKKELTEICSDATNSSQELTSRENQVLTLVAEGKKSKDIADLLSISIRTVEHHRANIMKKSGMKNTAELIKFAIQKGFITTSH